MPEQTTHTVLTKTFTADLYYHGSWGSRDAGRHQSTMTLTFTGDRGDIDWDIPAIDDGAYIGLTFDIGPKGERTLIDYDGVMALPAEAVDLLREAGVTVPNEFDDRVRFRIGNAKPVDYWDLTRDNIDDPDLCGWAASAKVGDVFGGGAGVTVRRTR